MRFRDLVDAYMRRPSPATWQPLKQAILADTSYEPLSTQVRRANELLCDGQHFEALRVIDMKMPGLFFSPSAHSAQQRALAAAGRDEAAHRALLFARAAYRTIDDSGDGSRHRPWRVLRISDEYDFLELKEVTSVRQSLESLGQRRLDAHTLEDGRVVYFEMEVAS